MDSTSRSGGGGGDDRRSRHRSRHRSHESHVEPPMHHHREESEKKEESDRRCREESKSGRRYYRDTIDYDGEEPEKKRRREGKGVRDTEEREMEQSGGRGSYSRREEQEKRQIQQCKEESNRGKYYDQVVDHQGDVRKERRRSEGKDVWDKELGKRDQSRGRGDYHSREEEEKGQQCEDGSKRGRDYVHRKPSREEEGKERKAEKDSQQLKNRAARKRVSRWDDTISTDVLPSFHVTPSTEEEDLPNKNGDRVLVLHNVFDGTVKSKMKDNDYYFGIRNFFLKSIASCGPVHHVHMDKIYGSVYMLFDSVRTASKAAKELHGKCYDDKLITVSFYDTARYKSVHRLGAM